MSEVEPGFGGVIGRTYRESTPWWPEPVRAPEGAPNIVFIVLDDVGFAHLGCYGSDIETPTMDRLAANGLRYTNFHTTAMCSPTRACLLTGRNHHAAGVGAVAEYAVGFPGYHGFLTKRAATLAEVLGPRGYSTFAVGKWHLMPLRDATAAGPFDYWPVRRGFDRWYGFPGGYTDQWYPELYEDDHAVEPPATPEEGYHLSEDLVDRAIGYVRDQQSVTPVRRKSSSKAAATSGSLPGSTCWRLMMRVTREPKDRNMWTNSTPVTPEPMTTRCSGSSGGG